jgi:hypothetical protein
MSAVAQDLDSFKAAWTEVSQTLVLQFAKSAHYDITSGDATLRSHFLRQFGLDCQDLNNTEYNMAVLRQRTQRLEQAFGELTANMDWIDKHENLRLCNGEEPV